MFPVRGTRVGCGPGPAGVGVLKGTTLKPPAIWADCGDVVRYWMVPVKFPVAVGRAATAYPPCTLVSVRVTSIVNRSPSIEAFQWPAKLHPGGKGVPGFAPHHWFRLLRIP